MSFSSNAKTTIVFPSFPSYDNAKIQTSLMIKSDPFRLRRHLEIICRPRDIFENRTSLQEVEEYLSETFRSWGYTVREQPFSVKGQTLHNLIVTRQSARPVNPFIIGAHFDAVPGTPAADDNGSGVAALLEIARLLGNTPAAAAVELVAFNAEEYGMLGSSYYVAELKRKGIPIQGMVSLEMIAYTSSRKGSQRLPFFLRPFYPDTGNFIALVGDTNSARLLKAARSVFEKIPDLPTESLTLPFKGRLLPEARLSDHSPFWDAGYPALLVTDTSFFRNPYYHTPADTIETLDLSFLAKVTDALILLAHQFMKDHEKTTHQDM